VLRALSRLELVAESLRSALNALAQAAPEWLRAHADPLWFERYRRRIEEYRLPQGQEARREFASAVGQDGYSLLAELDAPDAPPELGGLPEVAVLREVWAQQYTLKADQAGEMAQGGETRGGGGGGAAGGAGGQSGEAGVPGQVALRGPEDQRRASERVVSPYEPEARYGAKRSLEWVGYKSHLTESCDQDLPNLVIDVATTIATIPDILMLGPIQQRLSERSLLPAVQLVDAGYVGATELLESRQTHGIALIGPTLSNHSWQAKAGEGFSADRFQVDWEAQVATCPMGNQSSQWCPIETATGQPMIHVGFRKTDCDACPVRERCTKAKHRPRSLTLHIEPAQHALELARKDETTADFRTLYNLRSGIEGTFSQGVRAFGLRRARYRGLAKTHLQSVATVCAIDIGRVDDYLNRVPKAKTRQSRFAALASVA
jgi:transposase